MGMSLIRSGMIRVRRNRIGSRMGMVRRGNGMGRRVSRMNTLCTWTQKVGCLLVEFFWDCVTRRMMMMMEERVVDGWGKEERKEEWRRRR